MSEQTPGGTQPANTNGPRQVDPSFFTAVNEYLDVTNSQARVHGLKGASMAILYAAARFNAHVYLYHASAAAADRTAFLDYMGTLYRRALNEHLDGLGKERGIDVGESELAAEYAAAAAEATTAAGPVPPVEQAKE